MGAGCPRRGGGCQSLPLGATEARPPARRRRGALQGPGGELAPEAYLCLLLEMGVGRRRPREGLFPRRFSPRPALRCCKGRSWTGTGPAWAARCPAGIGDGLGEGRSRQGRAHGPERGAGGGERGLGAELVMTENFLNRFFEKKVNRILWYSIIPVVKTFSLFIFMADDVFACFLENSVVVSVSCCCQDFKRTDF